MKRLSTRHKIKLGKTAAITLGLLVGIMLFHFFYFKEVDYVLLYMVFVFAAIVAFIPIKYSDHALYEQFYLIKLRDIPLDEIQRIYPHPWQAKDYLVHEGSLKSCKRWVEKHGETHHYLLIDPYYELLIYFRNKQIDYARQDLYPFDDKDLKREPSAN